MRRWRNSRGGSDEKGMASNLKSDSPLETHVSMETHARPLLSSRMTTCPTKEDDDKKCAVVLFPADDYLSLYFLAAYLSASSLGDATRMEYLVVVPNHFRMNETMQMMTVHVWKFRK